MEAFIRRAMEEKEKETRSGTVPAGPSDGRVVACDFDNTLYFMKDEEPLRAADIFAILYYQQRGGLFGLCTGRSLVGVTGIIRPYIRPDFYILASGALVLDGEEKVLFKKCLPLQTVEEIYCRFVDPDPTTTRAVIQANDTVYTLGPESYMQTHIDSFAALEDADVYGLSLAAPDKDAAAQTAAQINESYGEEVAAFLNVTHVDLVPRGCSKGHGIEVIRSRFSVREMYGIGDSYNDLPLLRSVDHPWTLPCAPQEVQQASEGIVRSVSELLDRI